MAMSIWVLLSDSGIVRFRLLSTAVSLLSWASPPPLRAFGKWLKAGGYTLIRCMGTLNQLKWWSQEQVWVCIGIDWFTPALLPSKHLSKQSKQTWCSSTIKMVWGPQWAQEASYPNCHNTPVQNSLLRTLGITRLNQ